MRIELQLLGYPRITKDGQSVTDFISTKALVLFCYLVLEGGTHSRESLSALLWGDVAESRAKSNLRQVLHNIQKLFPDCFEINRQSVTVLDQTQFHVDILELQSATLEQINQTYQSEFLDGIYVSDSFQLDEWLRIQRERCYISYMTLLETLTRRYITTGQWAKVETTLQKLIHIEPWKEAYHRELMICLARQGKYTAAIKQYEACCQMLAEEFDEAPSYDTQRIYDRILAARHRRYDYTVQNHRSFFGRGHEIEQIEAWLLNDRLITIVGQGGIGKTHLAQHIAKRNEILFLNGIVFLSLNNISNEHQLVRLLCDALDVPLQQADNAVDRLIDYLQGVELLIVLDNFEQLLDSVSLIDRILTATLEVTMLVTSRERLNLSREHVLELGGLQAGAAQLFVQRARQIQPDFTLTDTQSFKKLCQYVDGLPLALELAAGWVDTLSLDAIIHELQQNLDVLSSPLHDIPERHRSIRQLFDQIWGSFSDEQQHKLLMLTVFCGHFSFEAARAVTQVSAVDLRTFVNKGWLHITDQNRYGFHELIRQYLQDKPFDRHPATLAHAAYYGQLLSSEAFKNPYGIDVLNRMRLERENINTAWNWSVVQGKLIYVEQMLDGFVALYLQESRFDDVIALLENVQTANPHDLLTTKVLSHLGKAYYYVGKRDESKAAFEQSLQLAQQHEDAQLIGLALHGMAACYMVTDWDTCKTLLKQSITVLDDAHDTLQAALTRNTLGAVYNFLGKREEALPLYQQAYDVLHQANDARFVTPLRALVDVALRQQDFAHARELLILGCDISEQTGNQRELSTLLLKLGDLEFIHKNDHQAKIHYEESLVVSRYYGESMMAVDALGRVAVHQGHYAQAIQHFSRAIQQGKNRDFHMIVLLHHAELCIAMDRHDLADALAYCVLNHPSTATNTAAQLPPQAEPIKPTEAIIQDISKMLHIPLDFLLTILKEIPL